MRHKQIAAIPIRRNGDGAVEVLLITSRETKRWVIPKGWPMHGLTDAEAAAVEAWEEAGVHGTPALMVIGTYTYDKRQSTAVLAVHVEVYVLDVSEVAETWPEAGERQRVWVTPAEAAARVQEPGLSALLAQLG